MDRMLLSFLLGRSILALVLSDLGWVEAKSNNYYIALGSSIKALTTAKAIQAQLRSESISEQTWESAKIVMDQRKLSKRAKQNLFRIVLIW